MNLIHTKILIILIVAILATSAEYAWHHRFKTHVSQPATAAVQGMAPIATPPLNTITNITLLATDTDSKWFDDQIALFNTQYAGRYQVTQLPAESSSDAILSLATNQVKPVIFAPSIPIWLSRLNESWQQRHPHTLIADTNDPQGYHVLLKSPMVVLTIKENASFLRHLFSDSNAWPTISGISQGVSNSPWGTFKFAYADPIVNDTGLLTLSMILQGYAGQGNKPVDLEQSAKSFGFRDFLQDVDISFVYDKTKLKSSDFEQAYIDNPGSLDFITISENKAIEAVQSHPELTVIYPNPTLSLDQSAAILNAEWVTPKQREAAIAFLTFLSSAPAQQDGTNYHFRPAEQNPQVSLASQIRSMADRGLQETINTVEMPSEKAIDEALQMWVAGKTRLREKPQ